MKKAYSFSSSSIPVKSPNVKWREQANGSVYIVIEHKDFIHMLKTLFFDAPKKSVLDLDFIGSEVWRNINGQNSVCAICNIIKKKFSKLSDENIGFRVEGFLHSFANLGFIEFKEVADSKSVFKIKDCQG